MTSPDSIAQITALGLEPVYSAREAAVLLGRSYSWLDQRVRGGQFTNPDGSVLQPLRTPGGYRRFRQSTLKDIALCCYRHRWFTMDALKLVLSKACASPAVGDLGRAQADVVLLRACVTDREHRAARRLPEDSHDSFAGELVHHAPVAPHDTRRAID